MTNSRVLNRAPLSFFTILALSVGRTVGTETLLGDSSSMQSFAFVPL